MNQPAVKDLNYYLSRPDEMPTDPKEIERLANEHMESALEAGTEEMNVDNIVGKADEPPGAAAAKDEGKANEPEPKKAEEPEKAEAKGEGKETPPEQAKPDGILAKDGKNVIPYSQLESARQRAAAAEATAKQQAEELAQLRAAQAGKDAQLEEDADMLSDEELDALAEDSPTLAKTLRAQQAAIRQLRETVQGVTQSQANQQAAEAAEVKSEIQSAIDGNPTLAEWQTAEDQTMWERASGFDKVLRTMPEFANVSFADRFAKVVELTQQALGQSPAPADEPKEDPPKAEFTQAQIKAAAQAALKKATSGKKPVSLSDLPGGAPPAVDERQKVEEMSAVALGNMFLGKSADEIQAYLATL